MQTPTPIEYLLLGDRAYNTLIKNEIDFIEQLAKFSSVKQLLGLKGIGVTTAQEIFSKTTKHGRKLSGFDNENEENRAS